MSGLADFIEKFDVKFGNAMRIIAIIFGVAIFIIIATLSGVNYNESRKPEDTNVYLNEEVCFAGDIYIKVVALSVDKDETITGNDADGDNLSPYRLNLTITLEQRKKLWARNTKIKPDMFTLKCINLRSKNAMSIFFEQLAQQTIDAAISIAVDGSVNILEDTINFVMNYASAVTENIVTENKFKPIKNDRPFEAFKPKKTDGIKTLHLSFPIKQEYMDSDNTIVLAIDAANHIERRIYLITRPE